MVEIHYEAKVFQEDLPPIETCPSLCRKSIILQCAASINTLPQYDAKRFVNGCPQCMNCRRYYLCSSLDIYNVLKFVSNTKYSFQEGTRRDESTVEGGYPVVASTRQRGRYSDFILVSWDRSIKR